MKYILFTMLILTLPVKSWAASLSLGVDNKVLANEARAEITLSLDSPDQKINALGGELSIEAGNAEFAHIEDGSSIISAWVERPHLQGKSLIFSGIIPGGYSGTYSPFSQGPQPGVILKTTVTSPAAGKVTLVFNNIEAYVGNGEKIELELKPRQIVLDFSKASQTNINLLRDSSGPIFSSGSIIKLPQGDKSWFLAFSAEDPESGIDYFEIQETVSALPQEGNWKRAESPYRLEDQSRKKYIFIRAVNRQGEKSVLSLSPLTTEIVWYYKVAGLVFALLIAALWLRRLRLRL